MIVICSYSQASGYLSGRKLEEGVGGEFWELANVDEGLIYEYGSKEEV